MTDTSEAASTANSSYDVTSALPTTYFRSQSSSAGGATSTGNSPWLWAPHVAIGAMLLALMAASFVRFHCKYGDINN